MKRNHYAVILSGGRGERFWPVSTARKPKQLLALVGGVPLITQAVRRLKGVVPPDRIFIVTSKLLVAATRKAVPELPASQIVGEPVGRDTAAAVALAGALVAHRDPKASFCVLTADHVIGDLPVFRRTLRSALDLALRKDVLITIGLKPTFASTGYGYIEAGSALPRVGGTSFAKAKRFVEKPNQATAKRYAKSDRFYWNSGMFAWSVPSLHAAFRKHRGELADMMEALTPLVGTPRFARALRSTYEGLGRISIDYALMEKAPNIIMARGTFAWDDVGAWDAMEAHLPSRADGNTTRGDVEAIDSADNIVISGDRLTALVGVRGLVVVQAKGVTLVCAKDRAQDVKKLVEHLRTDDARAGIL